MGSPGSDAERPKRAPVAGVLARYLSADLRSLALFRIYLGALLVGDLLMRLGQTERLYSNDGVLSNHFSLYRPLSPHQFSIYVTFSSARDVTAAFVATLVVYVLFTIGYRTRLFQAFSFVCVTSLHSRNLLAELPSDVPLHLWMGWSLFLPLGARYSWDSLRRSLARRRERSPDELNHREAKPATFTSIAVLGMLLQLAVMHLVTGLHQSGPSWRDGTAIYYALRQYAAVTDLGAWVADHLPSDKIRLASAVYRNSEIVLGVLALVPLLIVRRVAVIGFVLFHALSRALFDWGPYDAALFAGVPLLVSSEDWAKLERWYQARKPALTVYFDADCGVCLMFCRLLVRLDVLGRLTFLAGSSETAPSDVRALSGETAVVVNAKTGETLTRSRAFAAVLGALPLGAPWAWALRRASWLGDRLYEKFAQNRAAISVWLGFEACGVPRVKPATLVQGASGAGRAPVTSVLRELAAATFLAVCALALAGGKEDEPGGGLAAAIGYPRIFQVWNHLAPDPSRRIGTVIVDGQTTLGTRTDPLTGLPPVLELGAAPAESRQRVPPLVRAFYASVSRPNRSVYLNGFRDYIAKVGDQRPADDKLVAFTVDWLEAPIPQPPDLVEESVGTAEPQVPRRKLVSRP